MTDALQLNNQVNPLDQSQLKIRLESEAKLFIQTKIYANQIELVWSYILDYENNFNPFEERRDSIKKWKKHMTFRRLWTF